jgi:hypothetical protein
MLTEIAEKDILEALQDARSMFNVDDDRIYLAGECDGGRNALLMAEDYPEIFSAVSVIRARIGEEGFWSNARMTPDNVYLRLRNLSSIPVRLVHSALDIHSPVSQDISLTNEAKEIGFTPQLNILPGTGEYDLTDSNDRMFEFFSSAARRETTFPYHLTFAVTEIRHNQMYWLRINRLRTMNAPGYVTVEIGPDRHLKIVSENVESVTINTLKFPANLRRSERWVVVSNGGQAMNVTPNGSGTIVLRICDEPSLYKRIFDLLGL